MEFIVRDFQSIEEAKISVKGLTLLLGQTSSGKSAFTRAISAACQNRFKQGQVRDGQDRAVVKIHAEESDEVLTVIRPYGGSIKMQLGQQQYSKVARTVPEPILKYLNLGSLEVGSDNYSLNFHPQFQKPLLLAFSNKRLMDILSASKELDRLNELKDATQEAVVKNKGALRSVDSILTAVKEKLSLLKEERAKKELIILPLKVNLGKYEQVQTHLQNVAALRDLISEHTKCSEKELKLNSIVAYCTNCLAIVKHLDTLSEFHSNCSEYLSVKDSISLLNQLKVAASYDDKPAKQVHEFYNTVVSASHLEEQIDKLNTKIALANDLNFYGTRSAKLASDIDTLTRMRTMMSEVPVISTKKVEIAKALIEADKKNTAIAQKRASLAVMQAHLPTYLDLSKRIKELERVTIEHICPICGNNINNHTHGLQ